MFYFHKVAYVQYLGKVDIFSCMSKTFLPLYNSANTIKIDRDFPKLWSQMYCHLFYGSQCISFPTFTHQLGFILMYSCKKTGFVVYFRY